MAITAGTDRILEAARAWKLRSLLGDQSVFSNETLWTREVISELQRDFVQRPDEGEGTFLSKLQQQLQSSSIPAKHLAAEMLWVLWLFPSKISREFKLGQIRQVWEWAGSELPRNLAFEDALEPGVGGAGQAYLQLQWAELAFFIEFVDRWKLLTEDDRRRVLSNPWEFAEHLDKTPGAARRQFRHMLLHLLFPETFERIASGGERRKIIRSFESQLGHSFGADLSDNASPLPMDKALSEIRRSLSAKYPGPVDFYLPPLRQLWKNGTNGGTDGIQVGLAQVLTGYLQARSSEEFSGTHPIASAFRSIHQGLLASTPVTDRPTLKVKWSMGAGNWARVPWIAMMDTRETVTTQSGVYCVWLFRQDMTGVYLTLNQGVTTPRHQLGTSAARDYLRKHASEIRGSSESLLSAGFKLDDGIDLRAPAGLGREYEDSTIAYRYYPASDIPEDVRLLEDVEAVLEAYDQYLEKSPPTTPPRTSNSWIFQANPKVFDLEGALKILPAFSWNAKQHAGEMRPEDRVFMWESGSEGGILAVGTILSEPTRERMRAPELRFALDPHRFDDEDLRVDVRIDKVLKPRLFRRDLSVIPGLSELAILHQAQSTNFRVSAPEAEILMRLVSTPVSAPVGNPDLRAIRASFESALADSNIRFGSRHSDVVRTFLTSLTTKPFVILTGLSGSGKTQLAYRFGEWLGKDRLALIPVRPDWTGPEQLLGYEDALLPIDNGRRGWHVPQALEFMLRAARDLANPYVLILDEMNLAHVERYFADVLSGMESRAPTLPNLRLEDGTWRRIEDEDERVRFPENLFLIGTVNVDETTYMFSPKVLDRSNTIEFRVESSEFDLTARRPIECIPGPDELVRGFLLIATDDEWQHNNTFDGLDTFKTELVRVHELLAAGGFEFGHRVFYEAARFASILNSAGEVTWEDALDLQILQKLLPRLHGSRRRLEPTLSALERYCLDLTYPFSAGSPKTELSLSARLHRSHSKILRMMRNLQANQFASFTE